jgi:hypothetical protein
MNKYMLHIKGQPYSIELQGEFTSDTEALQHAIEQYRDYYDTPEQVEVYEKDNIPVE